MSRDFLYSKEAFILRNYYYLLSTLPTFNSFDDFLSIISFYSSPSSQLNLYTFWFLYDTLVPSLLSAFKVSSTLFPAHNAGLTTETFTFKTYKHASLLLMASPKSHELWKPFQTCLDFEFAELVLDAGLNNQQADKLIKLFHHCINNREKSGERFTLSGSADLQNRQKIVKEKLTPVSEIQ